MSEHNMEHRVTTLEVLVKNLAIERAEQRQDIAELLDKLNKISVDLAKHVPCPAPGLCNKLEDSLIDQDERIRGLEESRSRSVGERAAIGFITGAIAGPLGGIVVGLIMHYITK